MPSRNSRAALRRVLAAGTAAAALTLTLAQGAQAAAPAPVNPVRTAAAPASAASENPFDVMDLDGLRATHEFMCPAGHCVDYWSLVLTEDRLGRHYSGGRFFVYAPATGEFSFFLNTDIATRTVSRPEQVRIVDVDFLRSHPRVEVRYGNPDHPRKARTVATSTIWM
ncbi:hypothetical protein AB0K09_09380 [Streptomyces sp. NPDC049577]|uniref:hypothetical protein n=1 Tax=Streptomyces sp. NPDC049577 TaxID=3155153 RepID=UPI003412565A